MDYNTATKIRRYARTTFNRLREEKGWRGHPSFEADKALDMASDKFNVGYGTEGFCDSVGRKGVTYIGMDDIYDLTVYFVSETEQFRIGSIGDLLERRTEEWMDY